MSDPIIMFNFTRDRDPWGPTRNPFKAGLLGLRRDGVSESLLAPRTAELCLTPTPPSVTSASRVRLFPSYVGGIFLPSTSCFNAEALEINNRGQRTVSVAALSDCGFGGRRRRMYGRGLYTSKFPSSVKPDPPVR